MLLANFPAAPVEKPQAPSPFESQYLETLRAIIRLDEPLANTRLNRVKKALNQPAGSMSEAEADIRKDLAQPGILSGLYGDYKSDSKTAWIKDLNLVRMIGRHLGRLDSTAADHAAFFQFAEKSRACAAMPHYKCQSL